MLEFYNSLWIILGLNTIVFWEGRSKNQTTSTTEWKTAPSFLWPLLKRVKSKLKCFDGTGVLGYLVKTLRRGTQQHNIKVVRFKEEVKTGLVYRWQARTKQTWQGVDKKKSWIRKLGLQMLEAFRGSVKVQSQSVKVEVNGRTGYCCLQMKLMRSWFLYGKLCTQLWALSCWKFHLRGCQYHKRWPFIQTEHRKHDHIWRQHICSSDNETQVEHVRVRWAIPRVGNPPRQEDNLKQEM